MPSLTKKQKIEALLDMGFKVEGNKGYGYKLFVVYRTPGGDECYDSPLFSMPTHWTIAPGIVLIDEGLNRNGRIQCGCGINVGNSWLGGYGMWRISQNQTTRGVIRGESWLCEFNLTPHKDVIVPVRRPGKIRTNRIRLIECAETFRTENRS